MINKISRYYMPSLNSLLFGDDHLNHNSNSEIFLAIQKFIIDSKRLNCYTMLNHFTSDVCVDPIHFSKYLSFPQITVAKNKT